MFTNFRFLTAFIATALLSFATLAQPLAAQHSGSKPAPQQTAPAKSQTLAMASVRATEASTTIDAPETLVLKGTVVRADGQPLPGAGVYLAGFAKQLVVTDEHGGFSLTVPAGRPVAVYADYFGLGSTRVSVSLPVAQPLRITIGN